MSIPQSVLEAHGLAPSASERLLMIDKEMSMAVATGDTAKLRQLQAQKKHLNQQERREIDAILALAKQREIAAPKKGEQTDLDKRARKIEAAIAQKQAAHQRLLARLSRNPESENVLNKIDKLTAEMPELNEELTAITARLEQIERWHEEQQKKNELATKQAEWERKLPEYRRRLETVTSKMVRAWKVLDASIRQLDDLQELLRDPQRPADPLEKTYEQIRERTGGAVSFTGSRWIFDREVER